MRNLISDIYVYMDIYDINVYRDGDIGVRCVWDKCLEIYRFRWIYMI